MKLLLLVKQKKIYGKMCQRCSFFLKKKYSMIKLHLDNEVEANLQDFCGNTALPNN